MSKVTMEEPTSWKRVLSFEVPEDEINQEYSTKLKDYSKKVKLPGFRAGKVPANLLEKKFGDSIRAEAVEKVIQSSVENAFKEHNLNPISRPQVKKVDYKKGSDMTFQAEVEIDPPFELNEYKGLGKKPVEAKVDQKEVDQAIDELQERMAELKPIERPLKKGDYAVLEYRHVEVDGEVKKEFKNPSYPVEVGNSPLKEFNEALVGASAGEERTVNHTYPDDFEEENLRGKSGVYKIFVKEVKEKILPNIDDEFAKDVGKYKDLQELKGRIEADLKGRKERQARAEAEKTIIEKIIEKNPFEVPESQILNVIYMEYDNFKKQYPKANLEWEKFQEDRKPLAEFNIKRYKIVNQVAKLEKIKATQAEVDEELKKIAEIRKLDFEKVKEEMRRDGSVMNIRDDIKEKKVFEFLINN